MVCVWAAEKVEAARECLLENVGGPVLPYLLCQLLDQPVDAIGSIGILGSPNLARGFSIIRTLDADRQLRVHVRDFSCSSDTIQRFPIVGTV